MDKLLIVALAMSLIPAYGFAQVSPAHSTDEDMKEVRRDAGAARLITSDIENFWRAYDATRPDFDLAVFDKKYFDVGSDGLKAFKKLRIDSCRFAETLKKHPMYYASIRESTLDVGRTKQITLAAFRKFGDLYDDAVFPDVYFLIGCMNSGGTYTDAGLLIGVEMYGRTPEMPMEELSDWHRTVLKPIDELPYIVMHELIHYQQKYPGEQTLLAMAIKEGSADFLAELSSGRHINAHLHVYADPRQRELWDEFKVEMHGQDLSRWLFNGAGEGGRPGDLGYYVGYKIAEAYYGRAANKKQAIKSILEIENFEQFLEISKYEESLSGEAR